MQDLSLQLEKRTPKNYQIPPKNYPRIVFPLNFVGSSPISLSEMQYTCTIKKYQRIFTF